MITLRLIGHHLKLTRKLYSTINVKSSGVMTKIVCVETAKVNLAETEDAATRAVLQEACASLKKEHVIAVPTDTIYGLAGLAQSETAVRHIYDIKYRDGQKPIAICVSDVDDVYKWGNVTVAKSLLQALLPGPVTVVFERTLALNPSFNPGTSLVGIRVPDHAFVRQLAKYCNEPIALTSANISSQASSLKVEEFKSLWPKLDLVIDGGLLGTTPESRQGSTVVDLSKVGKYTIIRPGSAYEKTSQVLQGYGLQEEKKS